MKLPFGKKTGILLFAILFLLGIVILIPLAFEGKLSELVKKSAGKSINAKLEFSNLNLSLIRNFPKATVSLSDVSITGINQFNNDTLVAADDISMTIDLKSVFSGENYQINKLTIDAGKIKLKVLPTGEANWQIFKTDSTAKKDIARSDFKMQLNKISLNHIYLIYVNKKSPKIFELKDLTGVVSGDMTSDLTQLKLEAEAQEMNFQMDGSDYMKHIKTVAQGDIDCDFNQFKFTFHQDFCRLNELEGNLEGWLSLPDQGYDMDLRFISKDLNFKKLLSIVPGMYTENFADVKASGNVSLDLWAKGLYSDTTIPAYRVGVKVQNGNFQYPKLPKSVENVQIDLLIENQTGVFDDTQINLEKLDFNIDKNPFALKLKLNHPESNPNVNLSAKGNLDLGVLKDVYPLATGTELNGKLNVNLNFIGTKSQIDAASYENIKASGKVNIQNLHYTHNGLKELIVSDASLNINPKSADLQNLKMKLGASDFIINGNLQNYLAYIMSDKDLSGNLNLQSNYADIDELMSLNTSDKSKSTSKDTTKSTGFSLPKNIDFTFSSQFQKIKYGKMQFSDATGTLKLKKGKLQFDNFNLNAFGGKVSADGILDASGDSTGTGAGFKLSITDASFLQTFQQIDLVKKMMPVFEQAAGKYSVNLQLNGILKKDLSPDLNTLSLLGLLKSDHVAVKEMKAFNALSVALNDDILKKIQVKDLNLPFEMKAGRLITRSFNIHLGDVDVELAGVTSLDQTIDYSGVLNFPDNYTIKNSLIPPIVNFKLGGTFAKPKISIDTKSLVKSTAKQAAVKLLQTVTNSTNQAETNAKIQAIRQQAKSMADQIVARADSEAVKLVNKTTNPITKLAAQKIAEQLKKEAAKKAQSVIDNAEKKVSELNN